MNIKFRAWDKHNKVMLSWERLKSEGDFTWLEDDNLIIMQFTGLYDDDGEEIYDNDIIDIFDSDNEFQFRIEVGVIYEGLELTAGDKHGSLEVEEMNYSTSEVMEALDLFTDKVVGNHYEGVRE